VDESGTVASAYQEFGQGVKERAEWVGSEPADVIGSPKEFFEHGCPPRDREKKSPERASGLGGVVSASDDPQGSRNRPKTEAEILATPRNQ
jgi:hypothetical protein